MVQDGTEMISGWQEDNELVSQSPHLLVTTTPAESTCVAHQGVGEAAYVHR